MSRRPLTDELREKAQASLVQVVYASDEGQTLLRSLPSHESAAIISSRRRKLVVMGGASPFRIGHVTIKPGSPEDILNQLDRLVDEWVTIGEKFLEAAQDANPERLEGLAKKGAPVNYHDPRNGATALHYVAEQGARPALRALLKIGGCDFLARDQWGRLPSEMAGVYGDDFVMERFLMQKEIRQARSEGISPDQLYKCG